MNARAEMMSDSIKEPTMLVLDLDHTLLHEDNTISNVTLSTLRALQNSGIMLTVATARPVSTAYDIVHHIRADAAVYYNGALLDLDVQNPSHTPHNLNNDSALADIIRWNIPYQQGIAFARTVLQRFPNCKLAIIIHDIRYATFDMNTVWQGIPFEQISDITAIPEGPIDKIIMYPSESEQAVLPSLIGNDFALHLADNGTLWQVLHHDASKARAIETLCAHYRCSAQSVIAFGDDIIDISILQWAGTGVAVANARKEVLAVADDVCPSNDDDGVAQWLQQHCSSLLHKE